MPSADDKTQTMWLRSGNPETENEPTLYMPGQLGGNCYIKQPRQGEPTTVSTEDYVNKGYRLVQVDSSVTVAPFRGAVAWWVNAARYIVTTSPTALGRGRIAGVFQNAITPGYYGCVQTKGPGSVKFVDAPTAIPTEAGLIVIPSATAGKADCLAAGTAATYPMLGYSSGVYDAVNTYAVVDLDVPDTRS